MAQRDASVRLTLNASSFAGGIRNLSRDVEAAGKQMGKVMSKPLQEGFKAGRDAAKGLMNDIKGALKAAASLGGALAAGDSAKRAIELRSAYGQVAFQIEVATGKVAKLADIQKAVSNASLETSRTHEELASAMKVMLDRGADPTFALKSLGAVGQVMNATGMDAERVGRMMAGLSKMYGMSAQEAAGSLDAVMVTAAKSGATVEELFEDFTEFGSLAKSAGLGGKDGFNMMMSVLAKVGPKLNGTTSEMSSGLDIFLERMRDVAVMESTFKAGKGKFNKAEFVKLDNAVDQARYLMKAGPEVMAAFQETFTGREEKAVFEAFFGPYFDTLNAELAAKKDKTAARAAAVASVEKNIASMSTGFEDAGKVAGASAREQETAAAKLRQVQNTLVEAMAQPKTLEALNKLATQLPKVAEGMAKLISFVVENPMLAGSLYAGGRVGGAAAGAALQNVTHTISKKAFTGIGEMIAKDAAASGGWATAGKAIGIAAAALIAYEVGKNLIDKELEGDDKVLRNLNVATSMAERVAGDATASPDAKRKALEELLAARREHAKTPMSAATATFGKAAAFITGDDSLNPEVRSLNASKGAAKMTRVLEGQLGGAGDEAKAAADAFKAVTSAARAAATEMQRVKGSTTGSNGLPPQPGNASGAE